MAINSTSSRTYPDQSDKWLIVELVKTGLVAENEQISHPHCSIVWLLFDNLVKLLNCIQAQNPLISQKSLIGQNVENIFHNMALNVSS